jgi:hypothetical protein
MTKKQFELLLQTIAAGLVTKINDETGCGEDAAMEKLYSSELYSSLEDEKSKVWYYSIPMLYALWLNEVKTGRLILPEY